MSDFNKWFMDFYKSLSFWGKVEYRLVHFWENLWLDFYVWLWKLKGNPAPYFDLESDCPYSDPDKRIGIDGKEPEWKK
jgi:hypothetical protein